MDSSFDDILDRLNRGENPSLSELESDDGLIRHGGLNKSDILKMLTDGIRIMVSAAIIMTIVVLSPLKSAFQPNDGASHAGGKTVRAQKLYEIGNQYYYGDGAEQDYVKALEYYRQAAAMGYAEAFNDLGVMYHYGYGVNQDYNLAETYYREAITMGDDYALLNLGILCQNSQRFEEALVYYLEAVQKGSLEALNYLGIMYEYGYGVEQDYGMAEQYYEQAVQKGELIDAPGNLARVR